MSCFACSALQGTRGRKRQSGGSGAETRSGARGWAAVGRTLDCIRTGSSAIGAPNFVSKAALST